MTRRSSFVNKIVLQPEHLAMRRRRKRSGDSEGCAQIALHDPTRIDLPFTMSEITHAAPSGVEHAKLWIFADCSVAEVASPPSPKWAMAWPSLSRRPAKPKLRRSEGWWSQTGSNRRPHACKARALPAELWPRTRRRMRQAVLENAREMKWWAWEDLNFRPHAYQARALTN